MALEASLASPEAMTQTHAGAGQGVRSEIRQIIVDLRDAISAGDQHWFLALTAAVRNWPVPAEHINGREYRYLIGGEAFDWLLLAERLLDEVADIVPQDEMEGLVFHEQLPIELTEAEFQQLLGAKYKAHLNFVYGVRVESAVMLAIAEDVRKDHASRTWENGHADEEAFTHIYGRPTAEMLAEFREAKGISDPEWLSLAELSEWRYWLFQYRVKNCDPARVASDTRKGLAFLQHLERARPAIVETPR
jgi:hypothetical protein